MKMLDGLNDIFETIGLAAIIFVVATCIYTCGQQSTQNKNAKPTPTPVVRHYRR